MVMIIKSQYDVRIEDFEQGRKDIKNAANDNEPLNIDLLLAEIDAAANDNESDDDLSGLDIRAGVGPFEHSDEATAQFTRTEKITELDFSEERRAARGFLAE
jgi:hypothetical protein